MLSNYELQQYFFNNIKEIAMLNPNFEITSNFIYTQLTEFNVHNNQGPYQNIEYNFNYWIDRYKNNPNIDVKRIPKRKYFLWFFNGKTTGNEVKLYIPLDVNHLKEGANQLFDFISKTNIKHQSKIAKFIRNDNIVVRVNSMEDANTIIDYVSNNSYLKEGMLNVNPFLPSKNGVGITMDNCYSYNSSISELINSFFNMLKQNKRLDLFNVQEFNKFVKGLIPTITDIEMKDIYSLISKITDPNFKYQDFESHANNKLADKYSSDRVRITDPKFYFENAIKITDKYYPGNAKSAIFAYMKGNSNLFTRKEKARDGLVKYVNPGDIINIMRSKLNEKGMKRPNNDNELVDKYLNIILNKDFSLYNDNLFEMIKQAYVNTSTAYNINQARYALKAFILDSELKYFTNQYKDRDKLKNNILGKELMKIILNNIDINNLNVNNIEEIIMRFEETINSKKVELQI